MQLRNTSQCTLKELYCTVQLYNTVYCAVHCTMYMYCNLLYMKPYCTRILLYIIRFCTRNFLISIVCCTIYCTWYFAFMILNYKTVYCTSKAQYSMCKMCIIIHTFINTNAHTYIFSIIYSFITLFTHSIFHSFHYSFIPLVIYSIINSFYYSLFILNDPVQYLTLYWTGTGHCIV